MDFATTLCILSPFNIYSLYNTSWSNLAGMCMQKKSKKLGGLGKLPV